MNTTDKTLNESIIKDDISILNMLDLSLNDEEGIKNHKSDLYFDVLANRNDDCNCKRDTLSSDNDRDIMNFFNQKEENCDEDNQNKEFVFESKPRKSKDSNNTENRQIGNYQQNVHRLNLDKPYFINTNNEQLSNCIYEQSASNNVNTTFKNHYSYDLIKQKTQVQQPLPQQQPNPQYVNYCYSPFIPYYTPMQPTIGYAYAPIVNPYLTTPAYVPVGYPVNHINNANYYFPVMTAPLVTNQKVNEMAPLQGSLGEKIFKTDKNNEIFTTQNEIVNDDCLKDDNSMLIELSTMKIEDLKTQAFSLAKKQQGCRCLQEVISKNSELRKELISFMMIRFPELSIDQFGNYFVQKIIDLSSQDTGFMETLSNTIFKNIYRIGLNSFGTRVIQKIIHYLDNNVACLKLLISNLESYIPVFLKNPHGNHIIMILITKMFSSDKTKEEALIFSDYIEKTVITNLVDIANSKYGSSSIQKLLDLLPCSNTTNIINAIVDKTLYLVEDVNGNYVLQGLLKLMNTEISEKILHKITKKDNICRLINKEYSRIFVEKCFDSLLNKDDPSLMILLDAITKHKVLEHLTTHQDGIFIFFKALKKSDKFHYNIMVNYLIDNAKIITKNMNGKRLFNKLILSDFTFSKDLQNAL